MITQQPHFVRCFAAIAVLALALGACSSAPPRHTSSYPPPRTAPASVETDVGQAAVQIALQQVGVPYRYGGQSPSGFDCSGLIQYSYARAGQSVPRTTGALWSGTEPVSHEQLQVGDVLFFSIAGKMSHVGLYIGDGRFVHAPSSGKTVNVQSLSNAYYRDAFLRAGRPR